MNNNNSVNGPANDSSSHESQGMDWRERRYEWRRQMREERRQDPMRGLFFGLLLILGGGLFLAEQMNGITGDMVWKYFMVGLGSIFIIDGLVHHNHPEFLHFVYGKFVAGSVLMAIGLLFIFNYAAVWWPVVLIVAGCAFIGRLFFRRA
jgi:hypothetical protein